MELNVSQKSSLTTMKASQSTTSSHSGEFIYMILDSQIYMAGDKVTGEILLNTLESISPSSIELTCSGTEEVDIFSEKDLSTAISSDKTTVFSISIPFPFTETLNPGSYVFPFSLKLPAHSPSSFEFFGRDSQNNYIKSCISYSLCVSVAESLECSDRKTFIVKNKFSLASPQVSQDFTEDVAGCCSQLGTSKFNVSVLNLEHCEVGGEISFRLTPDNKLCKAPINRVVSKVCAEMVFSTTTGDFKAIHEIAVVDRATWVSSFSSTVFEKDFEYKCRLVNSDSMNLSSNLTPMIRWSDPVKLLLPFHVNPFNRLNKQLPKLPDSWNPEEKGIIVVLWTAGTGFQIKDMSRSVF